MTRQRNQIRRLSMWTLTAACALALSACGGGGGGGDSGTPPASTGGTNTGGGTTNNPTATVIRGLSQQAVANGNYAVDATTAGTVQITLPANANINVGDKVTVAGVSNNDWTIHLNAGQYINTSNLGGNTVPGATWAAAGNSPADKWWFAEASADGNTLAAVSNTAVGGGLGVLTISHDRGQTWTSPAGLPTGAIWTAVDVSGNGQTIVASTISTVYVSTDGGANWNTATGFTGSGLILDVAVSANGSLFAVAQQNGFLYTSTDGATFTSRSPEATATTHTWEAVSISDDGGALMAVESNGGLGRIYRSTNGGVTLTATGPTGDWYRADISGDGNTMVAAEQVGIAQVSHDGGANWTRIFPTSGTSEFGQVSVSTNGSVIAIAPRGTGLQVQLSTDGGATFAGSGPTGSFRGVAMAGDGSTLLSADNATGGRLNVSRGNRTAVGTLGSVTGGKGETLVLEYQGNGAFKVNSSTGDFVIQ